MGAGVAVLPAPIIPATPEGWRQQAACRRHSPDLWHPEVLGSATRKHYAKAIAICVGECRTRLECLRYAAAAERHSTPYGVYGGLTPAQRRKRPYVQQIIAALEAERDV